jgi:transposase InsO family protein
MGFTDDSSRWVWVYYLQRKSDAFEAFKEWLEMVERETGRKLRVWHVDNGGEFITAEWMAFLKARGIQLKASAPRTPEQNGVAEHQFRSISTAFAPFSSTLAFRLIFGRRRPTTWQTTEV